MVILTIVVNIIIITKATTLLKTTTKTVKRIIIFVATHALVLMIYGYILLVALIQECLTSSCVLVHNVSSCICCHKTIVVITRR